MKISINHTEYEVADGSTLGEVLRAQSLGSPGTAVAIGTKVIRRADYDTTILADGDKITVIKSVCGG